MRRLMQDMACTVADSDHGRYLGLSDALYLMMHQHNKKEEVMLFPMLDRMLGSERADLIRSMKAIAPGIGA